MNEVEKRILKALLILLRRTHLNEQESEFYTETFNLIKPTKEEASLPTKTKDALRGKSK